MGGMPMGGMPMGVEVREERRFNGMGQEEIVRITRDQFGEKVEVIQIGGGMPNQQVYVQPGFVQQPAAVREMDTLHANQGLQRGEKLCSRNGRFQAILHHDSNFVVQDGPHVIWATNTVGVQGPSVHLKLHPDGNLVLWNPPVPGISEGLVWETRSFGRANNPTLVMQDDGNLVIYNEMRQPIWASNTQR